MSDFSDKTSLARAGAPDLTAGTPDLTAGHDPDGTLPDFLQSTPDGLRCVECGAIAEDVEHLTHKDDCPYAA